MSSRKILLVSGCSFTTRFWTSVHHPKLETTWAKWPELLGEKLNMDVINLGNSGAGNEYIFASLYDHLNQINHQEIGMVIAAWSQCHRRDWSKFGHWTNLYNDKDGDMNYFLQKSLRFYYMFQCLTQDLPAYQFQMIRMHSGIGLTDKQRDQFTRELYHNQYFKLIDKKKFLGWPTLKSLEGWNMKDDVLGGYESGGLKYSVSEYDTHPNALGQQKIAEHLYDLLG